MSPGPGAVAAVWRRGISGKQTTHDVVAERRREYTALSAIVRGYALSREAQNDVMQ